MRAYAIDRLGEPGSVRELPWPEPAEGEVRVRVRVAGINAFDAAVVQGFAKDYMEHRFPLIPGVDASGEIEAVGPGVHDLTPGQEVYGVAEKSFIGQGTFAEFFTTLASAVSPKPAEIDHVAASTLPVAALTALSEIDAAALDEGQVVLVLGATGGVGSFATQLAARSEARVVAVTRGEYAHYARGLGATDVIDYTKGDLVDLVRERFPEGLNVVLDNAGDRALLARVAELVRPGGRVVSVVGAADHEALKARGIEGMNVGRGRLERLAEITQLVQDKDLRPPAVRDYPLEKAADALAEQATRHVKGKLALIV